MNIVAILTDIWIQSKKQWYVSSAKQEKIGEGWPGTVVYSRCMLDGIKWENKRNILQNQFKHVELWATLLVAESEYVWGVQWQFDFLAQPFLEITHTLLENTPLFTLNHSVSSDGACFGLWRQLLISFNIFWLLVTHSFAVVLHSMSENPSKNIATWGQPLPLFCISQEF